MPWQLTTPVDVGDLDPNGPYQQVKIMTQTHDARRMQVRLEFEYGNTVDGAWVAGYQPRNKNTSAIVEGDAYITMVTTHMPDDEELTYAAVKRGLYEYLADNEIIDVGGVV